MIKHVKADSLASVFVDSSLSTFTQYALDNGVSHNSIIFITCNNTDRVQFGDEYIEGSKWIWAKGEMYTNAAYPISKMQIDSLFIGSDEIYTYNGVTFREEEQNEEGV